MLSDNDVHEYQQMFAHKFGKELSFEEAKKRAHGLVSLLSVMTQPTINLDRLGDSNRPEASVHRKVGLASRS